ncbi:hypothetical protein ACJX0J_013469 [Zea mays]
MFLVLGKIFIEICFNVFVSLEVFIGGFAGVTRLFISYSERKEKTCRAKRIDSDEDIMSKKERLIDLQSLMQSYPTLLKVGMMIWLVMAQTYGSFGIAETRETFTANSALEIKLMASFGPILRMFLTEMARAPEWDIKFPNQGWLIRDDFHDMVSSIWDQEMKGCTAMEK